MEWMIDTANLNAIKEAVDMLPLAGITTNPSILKVELPFDYETQLKAIRALTPGLTMHVQLGSEECEGKLKEAAYLQNLQLPGHGPEEVVISAQICPTSEHSRWTRRFARETARLASEDFSRKVSRYSHSCGSSFSLYHPLERMSAALASIGMWNT